MREDQGGHPLKPLAGAPTLKALAGGRRDDEGGTAA
jgi:hypothetical protein